MIYMMYIECVRGGEAEPLLFIESTDDVSAYYVHLSYGYLWYREGCWLGLLSTVKALSSHHRE